MKKSPTALLIGLTALSAVSVSADCESVERLHEALMESSFSVERHFHVTVNGDLKKREVARLTYRSGELETEILEEEVLSKNMVFDSGGTDPMIEIGFSCDRLEEQGDDRYSVLSEDGTETAVLVFDPDRNALRPIAWRFSETERFLFKKFVIEGGAEYRNFEWLADAAASRD